jgi:hypothetical protein
MRRDLDDAEFVVGDRGAEFGGQADTPAPLRIGQQVTDLGDGDLPVLSQSAVSAITTHMTDAPHAAGILHLA